MTTTPERIPIEQAIIDLMGVHNIRRNKNLTPKEVGDYCRLVLEKFAAALSPQPLQSDEEVALEVHRLVLVHDSMDTSCESCVSEVTALIAKNRAQATEGLCCLAKDFMAVVATANSMTLESPRDFDKEVRYQVEVWIPAFDALSSALAQQGSK